MTRLLELINRYRQGSYPVFAPGVFLPIESMRARGLRFDRVLKNAKDMAEAALLNLDIGFEATVVPFDMNVEAELIGCKVHYHEEVDGDRILGRTDRLDTALVRFELLAQLRAPTKNDRHHRERDPQNGSQSYQEKNWIEIFEHASSLSPTDRRLVGYFRYCTG